MKPIDPEFFDNILNMMPINGAISTISYESGEEQKEYAKALYVLKAYGYVYLRESTQRIVAQGLTNDGVIFVSQGGFKEKIRRENTSESDAELQRQNWQTTTKTSKQAIRTSWWSILLAVLALFVSLYPLVKELF
jgi:hypothetical protein